MQGYVQIKNRDELRTDVMTIRREIINDLGGMAALIEDSATATSGGMTLDTAALSLVGDFLRMASTALDGLED